MAMPIKRTPVLEGKYARRFVQEVRAREKQPVSRQEYERARRVFAEVNAKACPPKP